MKNLTTMLLAIVIAVSGLLAPYSASADGGVTASTAADLEVQMNTLQKELIVLLSKQVDMLKAELVASLEIKLHNLQLQLVSLLQQQVTFLRAELNNR